ncbi:hypothetical protein [Corynebacterium freiburgense]|uniref:hypothetical protein n=1 Tax=Corynebacterium freiburgense TaxID=556548 RepID=UPI0003FB0BB6|nr:hypothetical protein [Corynebacterium freiburgense]
MLAVVVCICFIAFISYLPYPASEDNSLDWAAPDTIIVGFGAHNSPYDEFDQTSYSLYNKGGQKIDVARGVTRYFPGAVLVDGLSALNFYGEVRMVGGEVNRFKTENSFTSAYGFLSDGSSGVFIFDSSTCDHAFCYDFVHVFPGGRANLVTLAGDMDSYVIAEDETLVIVGKSGGEKSPNTREFSLKGIDHQAGVHDVIFPKEELFPDSETTGTSLFYLNDGRYLIVKHQEVAKGKSRNSGTVFRLDKSLHDWTVRVEHHTEPMLTTSQGVIFAKSLRKGRIGKIQKDGSVIV